MSSAVRTYAYNEEHELPREITEAWSLAAVAEQAMRDVLPKGSTINVLLQLVDGGKLTAPSVAAAHDELSAQHGRGVRMSITSYSATSTVRVMLSSHVYVQVESTSVVEANGWGETINWRIADWLENPWEVELANPKAVAAPPEKSQSWLARTWRDHTAYFVSTVIAGVIAGLLVVYFAIKFGLSS
jgi:hypothetical protein